MTDKCRRRTAKLIAGREVNGPIGVTFPHLEQATGVVMSGEHGTQSPIPGGDDRVRIRATQPQFRGIGNGDVVDGDDDG